MRFDIVSFVVAVAATAAAYEITSPNGGCIDITLPLTVTWTSVSTDQATFSLALTNYNGANPPVDILYENLVFNKDQGNATVPGLNYATAQNYSQLHNGEGYRIWMVQPNSPAPHNADGSMIIESNSFRIVAPGSGNKC